MYMTIGPHSIGRDRPLSHAHKLMKTHRIRHLPVLDGGALVGVITERDLNLFDALRDGDLTELTVEDAMSLSVYAVAPETPLEEVVSTMADHKYGCAVVLQAGHVVGIFTTVDVCRALAWLLCSRRMESADPTPGAMSGAA
jgi:acetoin utilization protein AcuB